MSYAKGARYERSLIQFLSSKGFSTLRVAGSGHNTPIDILAVKKGLILGVECKAHQTKPKIQKEKVNEMKQWCEQAGALGFLAWHPPKRDWLFLPLKNLVENKYEDEHWIGMDSLLEALL